MSTETEQSRPLSKLVAYLRRQGGQCNAQQPIVPVAGSELLKAADALEASIRTPEAAQVEALTVWADELDAGTPPRAVAAAMRRSAALAQFEQVKP